MPVLRDPRTNPFKGDRVLIRSEGTVRVVLAVAADQVAWRFEGGTVKRTTSLSGWKSEAAQAIVINLG